MRRTCTHSASTRAKKLQLYSLPKEQEVSCLLIFMNERRLLCEFNAPSHPPVKVDTTFFTVLRRYEPALFRVGGFGWFGWSLCSFPGSYLLSFLSNSFKVTCASRSAHIAPVPMQKMTSAGADWLVVPDVVNPGPAPFSPQLAKEWNAL